MQRPNYIIDRDALVDEAEKIILSGEKLIFIDTAATFGSGKSILLEQIKQRLEAKRNFRPVLVVISETIIKTILKPSENDTEVGSYLRELEEYIILLDSLFRKIDPDGKNSGFLDSARSAIRSLKDPAGDKVQFGDTNIYISRSDVKDSTIIGVRADFRDLILTRLKAIHFELEQAFINDVKKKIHHQRLVFLVDDYCYVIGHKIGQWLVGVLDKMEKMVVVIARTPTQERLNQIVSADKITSFTLKPFTREETQNFIVKNMVLRQFDNVPDLSQLVDTIYNFSHGHPGTVNLAADSIKESELKDIGKVLNFFDRIFRVSQEIEKNAQKTDDPQLDILKQRYRVLLQEILDDIEREYPDLELALHVGCVLNHYDLEIMKEIISQLSDWKKPESGSIDEYFNDLVVALNEYTFVEDFMEGTQQWHFHNFVHLCLQEIFKDKAPTREEQIHRLACSYYKDKIDKGKQEEMKRLYVGFYKYENSQWQAWTKEWLYHLSALEKRLCARLQFARAFFDAFNWWGWFLPFSYCDDLLDIWRICCQDANDSKLLKLLLDFYKTYPKGSVDQTEGNWGSVRTSLNNIAYILELEEPCQALDENVVFGFINWFIAESYWLCEENDQQFSLAEKYYRKARSQFVEAQALDDGQSWNVIWTDSYMADMYSTQENYSAALKSASLSFSMATSGKYSKFLDQDHEVISQNDRILGDIYLGMEQPEKAAQAYACAVYRAFAFNFFPHDMDEYTTTLYQNTCDLITETLQDLHEEDEKSAIEISSCLIEMVYRPFRMKKGNGMPDLLALFGQEDHESLLDAVFPKIPSAAGQDEFEDQSMFLRSKVLELRDTFLEIENTLFVK